MAKDPAVLWYWGDWNSGTTLFSRFLKGCYMDLLHAQFNNGRLSLEEIKTCLGSDFGQAWPTLQKKFKQDEQGLFFNERLEAEKIKRGKYTESRRKNREKKPEKTYDGTYDKHMIAHMENENEISSSNSASSENWKPELQNVIMLMNQEANRQKKRLTGRTLSIEAEKLVDKYPDVKLDGIHRLVKVWIGKLTNDNSAV